MYLWALNQTKLNRAIALGGTEDEIKARYISYGGAIKLNAIIAPVIQEVSETPKEVLAMQEVTTTEVRPIEKISRKIKNA